MSKTSTKLWEEVKQTFEAALACKDEEREAFLERVCANNPVLRREVDSLLRSYDKAGSFMEVPAIHDAAETLMKPEPQLKPGEKLKQYEILSPLGEGGMGEVYAGRDSILGRRVAIKLLPTYFKNDPPRLRRFKQEARTASALTHPNVCVIHEVGETNDNRPFIAMEYIEGVTVRQRIRQEPLSLDQALDIGIQVASALTAAHEAGIVHRDIKPENIMVRTDGYVKVLDFGLAKLTERRAENIERTGVPTLLVDSTPGLVMGTTAYMSPEQARGLTVDVRTDIWSLGVVLYEMITGQPPFAGETPTDVVIAIVEREPPPISHHIQTAPEELDRIVRKALRKDPDERYQLAKEVAIDLRTLQRELQSESELDRSLPPVGSKFERKTTITNGTASTGAHQQRFTRSTRLYSKFSRAAIGWSVLTVLVLGALIIGLYSLLRTSPTPATSRFNKIQVTKLTTNGTATFAAISPDGRYVGYVVTEAGRESLWLRQVAIPSHVQLVPPGDGHYFGIAFSPDGNFIYYGYAESDRNAAVEVYRLPVLGGTPTRLNRHVGPAVFAHDRKRLAFMRYDAENQTDQLVVANADESNEQVLATRKWPLRLGWDWDTKPAWSPDDKSLIIPQVNSDARGSLISLLEIELGSREERIIPLSSDRFEQLGHVGLLPDASGVIITARAKGASFSQVWRVTRDGSTRSITNDLTDYQDSRLTADGRSFVTVQSQTLANIWIMLKGEKTAASQVTAGSGRYYDLSWTSDGKIIYASDASGNADIFELEANGGRPRQLTANAGRNYAPAVSPDGKYVVFHSNRTGIFQLWRIERDGSNPKQLTFGDYESSWPQFSADGKWIYHQHFAPDLNPTIWRIPVDGGEAVGVTQGNAIRPTVSRDGNWLAYWQNDGEADSRWRLVITSLRSAEPAKIFEVAPSVQVRWDTVLHWGADSRNVTYVDHRGGVDNLWSQSIDGGPARQVTDFKDSQIFSFDWSRDGRLVVSRGVITRDVVMITDAGLDD